MTDAKLSFELLTAFDARQSIGIPSGEIGERLNATTVRFASGCELKIEFDDNGPLRVGHVEITACQLAEPFIILLRWSLRNDTQPYFMIPATLYGTNNADRGVVANHQAGTGGEPKLAYRAQGVKGHFSHSWHFRADHAAVPSVSATFDGQFVALGIEEATNHGTYNGVGLWTDAGGDSITVSIGSLDWPGRIVCHRLHPGRVVEPIEPGNAVGTSCRFCIYQSEAADRFAYEPFISSWYEQIHESPREGPPPLTAMRDVAETLVTDGINPDNGYFLMLRHADALQDPALLMAWAGLCQIARPLMNAGRILGEPRYTQIGGDMVDRGVAESISPDTGLFYDVYFQGHWQPNHWWHDLGHTALINGHACYLLLKMVEDDPSRKAWVNIVKSILKRVLPTQRADGRFPHGFSPADGSPTTFAGFGGCFFAAPLLMTGMTDAGLAAVEHYWQQFTQLEWIGVDLDCAGAQDSGSSYALIRALTELHRQTGDAKWLERAGHVLHYAFTYRFGHNTQHRYPVCDWSSSGSKVTSTHNQHLDAYGGEILEELHYYLQHASDPYLESRLDDSLAWARQAYNRTDGEYGFGSVGQCTEQYYQTYDVYQAHEGDGRVWSAYFPWASGSLLNAFIVDTTRSG